MNYYDKYIKYKNKYLTLCSNDKYLKLFSEGSTLNKNKYLELTNLIGGASRNYYLHIRFSKEVEDKFTRVKDALVEYDYIPQLMPAHITISYGPKIEYDEKLDSSLYENKSIDQIYPHFLENFKDIIPDIKYIGVTPFLRLDNIVIKAEIESDVLTSMIKFCRANISSYNETIILWKKEYDSMKNKLKEMFPTLFKEEHSFDENPIGALHITIITIKSTTPEAVIIDIMNRVETILAESGIIKGCNIIADRIDMKTPITKKFIDIYKYKDYIIV